MTDKPDGKRWKWRRWGMVALLIYLWGWLAIWLLSDFIASDFIGSDGPLFRILAVVYWPLIKLGELSFRLGFRS
jgi:hypothetical protein